MLEKASGPQVRLLRVATLSFGGKGPRPCVSLGHDALAKVASVWKTELAQKESDLKRRSQVRKLVAGLAAAVLVMVGMIGLAAVAVRYAKLARDSEADAHKQQMLAIENKMVADKAKDEALVSKSPAEQNAEQALASQTLAEKNARAGQKERDTRRDQPPEGGDQ